MSQVLMADLRVIDDEAGAEEQSVLRGVPHSLVPVDYRLFLFLCAAAYLIEEKRINRHMH